MLCRAPRALPPTTGGTIRLYHAGGYHFLFLSRAGQSGGILASMADLLQQFTFAIADRYAVQRELGAGGAATVYLARDLKHDRDVALKVLRPDLSVIRDRFTREITLVANLRHPHILPLHDSGEAAGLLFYVMPYVKGETIGDRLERDGRMAPTDAIRIAREVAGALDYAHRRGVIHRDIKPANILIEEGHAIVADFGVALTVEHREHDKITQPGLAVGTPAYMSPEQVSADSDLDARSDIYSLGCVLHEMLTGQPPFDGRSLRAIMAKRLTTTPPAVSSIRNDIPSGLDAVIQTSLAIKPEDRFATAAALEDALAAVEAGEPTVGTDHSAGRPRSIAVLPFVNMSTDSENEFFSDGVTEDIINALTKIPGLRVAARTSAFAFKGKGEDVRTIGRQLNVATVLEGSVRRAANRIRITAQLISVDDGYHIWSDQYDRELDDVFAVQDELSCSIVEMLKGELGVTGETRTLVKPPTKNMVAYDLYLKGRFFWNRRGKGLLRAREFFEQAIAEDSGYAQAYAGLGDTYSLLGWYRALPPDEAFPKAKEAAQRAIALDESLAEAHTSLAFALMCYDRDWHEVETQFVRALQLNPGYATTHHWYAEFLMTRGRLEEAIDAAEHAQQLDPLGLIIKTVVAMAYYFARQYDRSAEIGREILDMEPRFTPAYIWLGLAYLQLGLEREAIEVFKTEHDLAPERPTTLAFLGAAYARRGDRADAERILTDLASVDDGVYVAAFDRALIELYLGRREAALEALEAAEEERAVWLAWAKVDPMLDPLRDEPRFQQVLAKLGLA